MGVAMMGCGHTANAHDAAGRPVCAICVGIDARAATPVAAPDLAQRRARCSYHTRCGSERPSALTLAFFEHRPDREHDGYYCGCFGWD